MSNARQDKEYCIGDESVGVTNQLNDGMVVYVYSVGPHDVLMGRGAPITENPGNARLRQLVKERLPLFLKALRQKDKHAVAVDIVAEIKARGGRFLRKHNHSTVTEGANAYASNDCDTSAASESNSKCNSNSNSHLQRPCWIVVQDEKQIITKAKQLLRDMEPESMARRLERRMYRYRKLGQPKQETKKGKSTTKANPKSHSTESNQDKEGGNNSHASVNHDLCVSTNLIQETLSQGNETRPHLLSTLPTTSPPISTLNMPPLPPREPNSFAQNPLAAARLPAPTLVTNQSPSISPAILAQLLQQRHFSTANSLAAPTRVPPGLEALPNSDLSHVPTVSSLWNDPYHALLLHRLTRSAPRSEALSTPLVHQNNRTLEAVNPHFNALLGSTASTMNPSSMLPSMTSRLPLPSLRETSPAASLSLQALVERHLASAASVPRCDSQSMTVQAATPQQVVHRRRPNSSTPTLGTDNLQRNTARAFWVMDSVEKNDEESPILSHSKRRG